MLRCHQRAGDWQNEYKLFTSGLAVCPLNAKVRYNVAKVADAHDHNTRWALEEYKEAIRYEFYKKKKKFSFKNILKDKYTIF